MMRTLLQWVTRGVNVPLEHVNCRADLPITKCKVKMKDFENVLRKMKNPRKAARFERNR